MNCPINAVPSNLLNCCRVYVPPWRLFEQGYRFKTLNCCDFSRSGVSNHCVSVAIARDS